MVGKEAAELMDLGKGASCLLDEDDEGAGPACGVPGWLEGAACRADPASGAEAKLKELLNCPPRRLNSVGATVVPVITEVVSGSIVSDWK